MQNAKLKMQTCNLQSAIDRRGFTLVELLIAMAIASVLGMAGVSLFSSSNWAYKVNEDVAEAQQNVRVSMERLAKDIRTAGFGLPDPPFSLTIGTGTFTSPITVTTSGGSGGSDSITILGIGYEAGTLSKGAATDCNVGATSKICLDSVEPSTNRFFSSDLTTFKTSRMFISLNGSTFIQLSNTQSERAAGKLALGTPSTLDRIYPDGTPVYIIQAVTYSIENDCTVSNPCWNLKSNDLTELRGSGNQVLAENIEDIQFAYGLDGTIAPNYEKDGKMDSSTLSNDPADDSTILAVRAWVVAKTRNQDMKGGQFSRPAVEDRLAATSTDGYRRRILTKIIKLRNPRTGR